MAERQDRKEEQKKTERNAVRAEIFSWIRMIVIVVIVVELLTRFVIINVRVPSGSMEDTIMTSERLIGFRFAYWFSEPERGDIILFDYPVDESKIYIKRVIGLPEETVEIRDGGIYINGSDTPLSEDYLKEDWVWQNDGFYFEVPKNCYFVLGDNRNNSEDGRFWAQDALAAGVALTPKEAAAYSFVREDAIKGKAVFTYYRSFRILK